MVQPVPRTSGLRPGSPSRGARTSFSGCPCQTRRFRSIADRRRSLDALPPGERRALTMRHASAKLGGDDRPAGPRALRHRAVAARGLRGDAGLAGGADAPARAGHPASRRLRARDAAPAGAAGRRRALPPLPAPSRCRQLVARARRLARRNARRLRRRRLPLPAGLPRTARRAAGAARRRDRLARLGCRRAQLPLPRADRRPDAADPLRDGAHDRRGR